MCPPNNVSSPPNTLRIPSENARIFTFIKHQRGSVRHFALTASLGGSSSSSISACNDVFGRISACQPSVNHTWRALKRPLDVCFVFGYKKRPSGPTPGRQPASWPTTEPSLRTSNKLLRLSCSFSRLWLLDFQMKCINRFNLKKRTLNH